MSSLQNLAALTIFKNAARNQIKTIVKAPELVEALGPNRTAQLQKLHQLLKFLDLYVEHKKASIAYINSTRLREGERRLDAARLKRIENAKNKVQNVKNKAKKLHKKIDLPVYTNTNTNPFSTRTLGNVVGRISLLRKEGNNRRKLFNNLQALYARKN